MSYCVMVEFCETWESSTAAFVKLCVCGVCVCVCVCVCLERKIKGMRQ